MCHNWKNSSYLKKCVTVGNIGHTSLHVSRLQNKAHLKNVSLLKNGSHLKNVLQLEKWVKLRKRITGETTGPSLKYVSQFALKKLLELQNWVTLNHMFHCCKISHG